MGGTAEQRECRRKRRVCGLSGRFLVHPCRFLVHQKTSLLVTKVWDKQNAIQGVKMEISNCRNYFSRRQVDFQRTRDQRKVCCMRSVLQASAILAVEFWMQIGRL